MPKNIYAIHDNIADTIIGGLHLHQHNAPAVRMYADVANMPDSSIARHPVDFDLLLLGTLNDDNTITPIKEIILLGATWTAAQTQRPQLKELERQQDAS